MSMPLDEELMAILACPRCKGGVRLDPAGDELVCFACRLAYRVEDGVPVMLVEEARPLPPDQAD